MKIPPVGGVNWGLNTGGKQRQEALKEKGSDPKQPDVVLELSAKKPEKLTYGKPDATAIARLKEEAEARYNHLIDLIRTLVNKQAGLEPGQGIKEAELAIPPEVAAEAQQALESYYSVEETAGRIMTMAQSLAGGDKSKIPMLRKAVEEGFNQARQILGELPQISKDTYSEIMRQFEAWEKES